MKSFSLTSLIRSESVMTILDIGASLPETAPYRPLVGSGAAWVIGFAPNKEECDKLKQLHGATHNFFPYFVGDGKPAIFRETNWFATGSLFRPNKPLLELYQNLHEVTTLVAEHPIQTVALDDIPEISDVDTYLRAQGFQFVKFIGFGTRALKPIVLCNNPNVGNQYLWSDAIYIRDLFKLDAMSADKLIKLATVVHDVYGLYDFALHLLKIVDARQGTTVSQKYLDLILAA